MKKLLTAVCVALFAATLVMAACSSSPIESPKALAKQTYTQFQSALKAEGLDADAKGGALFLAFAGWGMQMEKDPTPAYSQLMKKVEKLPERDRAAYNAELAMLLGVMD